MKFLSLYLLCMQLISFAVCGLDKRASRRKSRRTPERRLFALCFWGGTLGLWLGMYTFRHKTRHPRFVWGVPGILLLQCALVAGISALLPLLS